MATSQTARGHESEVRLRNASARLALERPFLGALVLTMPREPTARCRSLDTDGERILYNPAYIGTLTGAQIQFVLAHVALHCALDHAGRRGSRLKRTWDAACDYAVNQLLLEDGLTPAPNSLLNSSFARLSAEEIYARLGDGLPLETLDDHSASLGSAVHSVGGGAAAMETGVASDAAQAPRIAPTRARAGNDRWRARLVKAAHQARLAGRFRASWERLLEREVNLPLPWSALLARFVGALARHDYSLQRLSRRDHEALLPSLHSRLLKVAVALDVSGSISGAELAEFVAELNGLKAQVRAELIVHACDYQLAAAGPWQCAPWETLVLPGKIEGGGGTRFTPIFDWIERAAIAPDCLIYFTDAMGEFPLHEPAYPVLWLVKGNARVPWGERVQMS